MAKRRCISIDVYENEGFIKLSNTAKCLYTYMILRSDDEGVVINPSLAAWVCKAGESEYTELMDNGFVLKINGLYVIRHWPAHNRIAPSKVVKSVHKDVIEKLTVCNNYTYEYQQNIC